MPPSAIAPQVIAGRLPVRPTKARRRSRATIWSYDDVNANADAILAAVRGGSMPCDATWPSEKVNLLQRWVDKGMPETNDPLPG